MYSPVGTNHDRLFPVTVWIYDPATDALYWVLGENKSLLGSNVDAVIAIARSLFEPPNAPAAFAYTTYDATGQATTPGSYAFLDEAGAVVTTYEGLRDGTATGLRIHKSDAYGASQAGVYDAVAVGDIFEWREAHDCFVRYPVTEVKDDPTGDPPRKLLAVNVMTYAFTGCSGAIDTTGSRTITWSPANLQSPEMTIPIRHGPWQLIPHGWTGAREAAVRVVGPPQLRPDISDLAMVRQHRLWSEPTLPAGWRLREAYADIEGLDGIFARYEDAEGGLALTLSIAVLPEIGEQYPGTTADPELLIIETRIIDDYPAYVAYSPADDGRFSAAMQLYREGVVYILHGWHRSIRGGNIDALIAIARSLYRSTP